MPETSGKINRKGARFVRFYPSDWRSGCIGLTLEQEGLYVRACAFIYETGRRIPTNDREAARMLGVHTNAYRKIRDQLAGAGKLVCHDDGWSVGRVERELAAATSAQTAANQERQENGQADQNTGGDTRHDTLGVTPLDTPPDTRVVVVDFPQQKQQAPIEPITSSHNHNQEIAAQQKEKPAALRLDLRALSDRLFAVAGPALASEAIAPGLASMNIPTMWIDQGCDLELDVIETLRVQAVKRRNIRDWNYFTAAISEAKAKRLAGLPTVTLAPGQPQKSKIDWSKIQIVNREPSRHVSVEPACV